MSGRQIEGDAANRSEQILSRFSHDLTDRIRTRSWKAGRRSRRISSQKPELVLYQLDTDDPVWCLEHNMVPIDAGTRR
jgi:hypothetical protein